MRIQVQEAPKAWAVAGGDSDGTTCMLSPQSLLGVEPWSHSLGRGG